MGRRQAVRQRILIPSCGGSNPPAPAIHWRHLSPHTRHPPRRRGTSRGTVPAQCPRLLRWIMGKGMPGSRTGRHRRQVAPVRSVVPRRDLLRLELPVHAGRRAGRQPGSCDGTPCSGFSNLAAASGPRSIPQLWISKNVLLSQRSTTRRMTRNGMAMQPSVADIEGRATCRKIALPFPGTVGASL